MYEGRPFQKTVDINTGINSLVSRKLEHGRVIKNTSRLKRKEEEIAFLSSNLLHTIRCLFPPKAPSRTFFWGEICCFFFFSFVSYWVAGCLFCFSEMLQFHLQLREINIWFTLQFQDRQETQSRNSKITSIVNGKEKQMHPYYLFCMMFS